MSTREAETIVNALGTGDGTVGSKMLVDSIGNEDLSHICQNILIPAPLIQHCLFDLIT